MSEVQVRVIREADLPAVRDLFYRCYGESYPYKEFYSDDWLKRSIYQDSYRSLLAEIDGQVVGTASIYFEVGAFADLCGEFGRLAVDPDYRRRGVGLALMKARLEFAEKRLHFGLAECRTAHTAAQRISHHHDFQPIGFMPQKALLEKRESLVLTGKLFGPARKLRKNNPRVIPEVVLLGRLALQNMGFESDLIAVDDVDGYPTNADYEVEELTETGLPSLLRIERGRLSRRLVFGNLQLTYGLFMLQARNSNYLVARLNGEIVGAIGFAIDKVGHNIRVLELIALNDDLVGFLLKELERRAHADYGAEYLEITVSAYEPNIQRTLSNLGFVPVAYCPSFVFDAVERLDTVKFAKVYVPLDIDEAQLTDASRQVFELVRQGFEEKRIGIVVNATTRHMAIFQGLEDGELSKIAALCRVIKLPAGSTILQAGESTKTFYMVIDGTLDVFAPDSDTQIGHIGSGEFLGEIALVTRQTHNATVVTASDVDLIALKHRDFEHLIDRYPRIGLKVMRNIATSLGQRVGTLNAQVSSKNS